MYLPRPHLAEDAETDAEPGERGFTEIVESPRPDPEPPLPTYHEMLDHLCRELGVPGSPTFWQAVEHVKRRLRP